MRRPRRDIDWPMHWAVSLPALTVPGWFDRTVFRHMSIWTRIPAAIGVGIAAMLICVVALVAWREMRRRHGSTSSDSSASP